MKSGPAVLALLLTIGCTAETPRPALPAPPPAPAPVASVSVPTPVALASVPDTNAQVKAPVVIDTEELAAFRTAEGRVSRVGTELRIRLLNGRTAFFKDDTTAGLKFALPRYAGYLKAIHSHAIHMLQYEGTGVYLAVDDSTGESTIVVGMPVPSPDGSRFALTSRQGMEGGNPGVIEVWRIVGRKPEKEFSYDTENEPWEATDAVWRDSVSIDFFKNKFVSFTDPDIQTPGRLTRTGTTWILADSVPARH